MRHLKTFESYKINENANITVTVDKAMEERPQIIFDQLGLQMPSDTDVVEYEKDFEKARKKAIKFYNRNPDRLKYIE